MHWLWAALICVGCAGLEALAAGKDPAAGLRALRQPGWSPPFWLWAMIGVAWYAICLISLARLLPDQGMKGAPALLLLALMVANAAWGVLQFRVKRFDFAFAFGLPYVALLAAFLHAAWPVDRVSFFLFVGYAAYLPYAAAWMWCIWRLNPRPGQSPSGGGHT